MIFRIVRELIFYVVVFFFFYYLWDRREELISAFDGSFLHVAAMIPLIFFSWYFSGLQSYYIYRATSIPITRRESFMLTIAGSFANHMPMRAGTIIKAYYLKEVHGLKYSSFGGIFGVRVFLTMIAGGLMGVGVILVTFLLSRQPMPSSLLAMFVLMVVGPVIVLKLPIPRRAPIPGKLNSILEDLSRVHDQLTGNSKLIACLIALLLVQYLILGVRFLVSADAINFDVGIEIVFLVAPLAALMSFVSVTPGGLGLREAIMGYVTLELGYGFSNGFFMGSIDRAILLLMTGVFGGISFLLIWRKCGRGTFASSG